MVLISVIMFLFAALRNQGELAGWWAPWTFAFLGFAAWVAAGLVPFGSSLPWKK